MNKQSLLSECVARMKPKRNTGMAAILRPRITLRFIRATDELPYFFCFLSGTEKGIKGCKR